MSPLIKVAFYHCIGVATLFLLAASACKIQAFESQPFHYFHYRYRPNAITVRSGDGSSLAIGVAYKPFGYWWTTSVDVGYTPIGIAGIEMLSYAWRQQLSLFQMNGTKSYFVPLALGTSIHYTTVSEPGLFTDFYLSYSATTIIAVPAFGLREPMEIHIGVAIPARYLSYYLETDRFPLTPSWTGLVAFNLY